MALQYNKTSSAASVKRWNPEDPSVPAWFISVRDYSSDMCQQFISDWKSGAVVLYEFGGVGDDGKGKQGPAIPYSDDAFVAIGIR